MQEFEYLIKCELGIHARPAGILVKAIAKYPCDISLSLGEKSVNAKRLFSVMGLCVKCGDKVKVTCDGLKEQEAIANIKQIFFDEF